MYMYLSLSPSPSASPSLSLSYVKYSALATVLQAMASEGETSSEEAHKEPAELDDLESGETEKLKITSSDEDTDGDMLTNSDRENPDQKFINWEAFSDLYLIRVLNWK